jgi:hypothetical protein
MTHRSHIIYAQRTARNTMQQDQERICISLKSDLYKKGCSLVLYWRKRRKGRRKRRRGWERRTRRRRRREQGRRRRRRHTEKGNIELSW